jgi:hypothetical protein
MMQEGPGTDCLQEVAMRVLTVEREPDDDQSPAAALTAAGHEVVRCDGRVETDVCAGMPGQTGCPLDRWPVDVAMAVRGRGGPSTEAEAGIRCAIRRHIPVMVVGQPDGAAYEKLVDEVVDPDDSRLAERIEELGRSGMEPAIAAVRSAIAGVLARHGRSDVSVDVAVTHTDTRLRVVARTSAELEPRTSQAAAVRALAALHELDLWFDRVDVDVSGAKAP